MYNLLRFSDKRVDHPKNSISFHLRSAVKGKKSRLTSYPPFTPTGQKIQFTLINKTAKIVSKYKMR